MYINEIILKLLNMRGINGEKEIAEFLSPRPSVTYDPFLLSGMKEGVDLILDAVNNKKKICIYGDYDADGITSVSVLKTVLEELTEEVDYYIPSRFDEGYGLNTDALTELYEKGTELIITVDCGISSYNEVEYCKSIGMDIIVTDHHNISGEIPDCIVINPKKTECEYPFKELAGCGVAFKLAQAIQRKAGLDKSIINNILDIVSIGTIGDIMPIVDENRTIVKYGLNKMEAGCHIGLKYLADKTLRGGGYTSENISFGIIPNLNAAGRMDDASIGVELFTEKDPNETIKIADRLIELNSIRKQIQEEEYQRCISLYETQYSNLNFPLIIMEDAHEGVAGIVAGKMKDYCKKPVAILTGTNGVYKGTSRGTDDLDIHSILKKYEPLFVKFGGHKGACGFTIEEENLKKLSANIEKDLKEISFTAEDKDEIIYDLEINGVDITENLIEEIELLEPFGNGNERPKFLLKNCILKSILYIGDKANHGRVGFISGDGKNIPGIYFNVPKDKKSILKAGNIVNVVGTLGFNKWNGRKNIQMTISDIIL